MAVPTLVQSVHTGMSPGPGDAVHFCTLRVPFPNASLANNLLVIGFKHFDSSAVTSVTDNIGNTWVNFSSTDDASNATRVQIWYVAGATAGVTVVTVLFNLKDNTTNFYGQAHLSEWYNVATSTPTDLGSAAVNDTASPYTAGSFTTTTAGDLILAYGWTVGFSAGGITQITAGVAGSGFTLMGADLNSGNLGLGAAAEYQIQASAGAINPDFSTLGNTTAPWCVAAVAFKAANAGTAPTRLPRIEAVQHQYLGVLSGSTPAQNALQFPCPASSNLLVGSFNDNGGLISALTDSAGNSWQFPSTAKANNANLISAQIVYVAAAVCSPTLKTMTYTFDGNAQGDPFIVLYAVVGIAPLSPFAVAVNATGANELNTPTDTVTITPLKANGLVICGLAVAQCDVNGVTVTGESPILDVTLDDSLNDGNGTNASPFDEDNGYGHVYNATVLAETWTWTATTGVTFPGISAWACVAAAFNGIPVPPHRGDLLSVQQRMAT